MFSLNELKKAIPEVAAMLGTSDISEIVNVINRIADEKTDEYIEKISEKPEYIYPEEIESIINNFRFVNESLVVESKGKLVAMVHFNMEELEKQVQKIKSQAGNYKTAINDYIEEQKKELFEYVNSRVNNFSKLQLVLVQHEPFEKTPTHKIKRFLYNNINIK